MPNPEILDYYGPQLGGEKGDLDTAVHPRADTSFTTLYAMVTKDNCMGTVECMLFDAVFCNVYDDMILSGDDI